MTMVEEHMKIQAKKRKDFREMQSVLGDLGFTRVAYSSGILSAERLSGHDLDGKPFLDFRVELRSDCIDIAYAVPVNRGRMARLFDVMPVLLNVLTLAEDYYDLYPSSIFPTVNLLLNEVGKVMDRDALEFSAQLNDLNAKHQHLKTKYEDLVRSSEANTRILLDCEQKNEELEKRIATLGGVSDELLRETIYNWVKVHGGSIEIREFAKANNVAPARVEEGLNTLMREGFLKRRMG